MDQHISDILSFRPLRMVFPYGWCGHLPFAAWLMKLHQPRIFVELGTHSGNSYFAFCQAVAEAQLETCCYAVDTWEGDEHSGHYGQEVFDDVSTHNAQHYASFSNLMRMRFDQALDYFSENSIDLLHIDGLHTYEAVKNDFESWLPKLSQRAIVVLHDINVREHEFGVWKLWGELSENYPHCSFSHSHGLGVLLVGSDIPATTSEAIQQCNNPQMRHMFVTLANGFISEQQRQELQQQLKNLQKIHSALQHNAQAQQEEAVQKIQFLNETIAQKEEVELLIRAENSSLKEQSLQDQKTIEESNQKNTQLDQQNIQKSQEIATQKQELQTKEEELQAREREQQAKEREVQNHVAQLESSLHAMRSSFSWRLTAPMRWLLHPLHQYLPVLKKSLELGGGGRNTSRLALRVLRHEGMQGVRWRLGNAQRLLKKAGNHEDMGSEKQKYLEWLRRYDPLDAAHMSNLREMLNRQSIQPLISIVMPVYNPPLDFLRQAIESVKSQVYENWELCIADDASNQKTKNLLKKIMREDSRIKIIFREKNGHISAASNSALEVAQGDFIALMDNDDMLPPHALAHVVLAINKNPDVALLYSDEDKIDIHNFRYAPYFKCDLNQELFLAQNMICHLGVYRRELVSELGGFTLGVEGAQDWDLALRVFEKVGRDQIIHIPKILYHWRAIAGSTALSADQKSYITNAQVATVEAHLRRMGKAAKVTPAPNCPGMIRVQYALPDPAPLISILIPTRDGVELLKICIESIVQKSTYKNYEIIIIDNGSKEKETLSYFEEIESDRIKIFNLDIPFNYSKLNNEAVKIAQGEYVCLMNNDIEVISPDWMEEMLSFAVQPEVGCVGACLWYPNNTLQHGGVILGIGGVAGHSQKGMPRGDYGYFSRAAVHQEYSAVTAACLLVRKSVYQEVGGLEEKLQVAFNDIDFCLKVKTLGYRNIWTPYAEMYHHESASRGYEDTPEKKQRFNLEVELMNKKWKNMLKVDPAYNPNLTLDSEDFAIAHPPRVEMP